MRSAVPYTSIWIFAAFWVLVNGAILFGTGWELWQNYLFAFHASPVTATVVNKYVTVQHGKGGKSYTEHIAYHYQVGTTVFHCRTIVKYETYEMVSIGDPMPVLYLVGAPSTNRIELPAEIEQVKVATFILISVSVVFTAIGAWIFHFYIKRNRLYRHLIASGSSTNGSVSSVDYAMTGRHGGIKRYYLAFTFCDDQGYRQTGMTWYLEPGDESRWQEGSEIRVYFDPHNSENFTVDLGAS